MISNLRVVYEFLWFNPSPNSSTKCALGVNIGPMARLGVLERRIRCALTLDNTSLSVALLHFASLVLLLSILFMYNTSK